MKLRVAAPVGVVLAGALLAACASTHLLAPLPSYAGADAATLYIQRPPGGLGVASGAHIAIDGTAYGTIGPGEYWRLRLKPGMHNVSIHIGGIGIAMSPGSTHCIVVGFYTGGAFIHPAQHCPPPRSWKLAAQSR